MTAENPIEVHVDHTDTLGGRRWERVLLAVTCFLVVCLLVITIGFQFQVSERNDDIRVLRKTQAQLTAVASDARDAARSADTALRTAIAAGSSDDAQAQQRATQQAITTIAKLEAQMALLLDRLGVKSTG